MSSKAGKMIGIVVVVIAVVLILIFAFGSRSGGRTSAGELKDEERTIAEIISAETYEKLDMDDVLRDYDEINSVYRTLDENDKVTSYVVFTTVNGYGGPMNVNVAINPEESKIVGLRVGDNNETEGVGSRVAEEAFYSQFSDIGLPVRLNNGSNAVNDSYNGDGEMIDGTYKAEGKEKNGFTPEVEIVVDGGEIKSVSWDEKNSEGEYKKNLSIKGEYDMPTDGLLWHEQAEVMEKYLVESQTLDNVDLDEYGKVDAISSVTIDVSQFIELARECMGQAYGANSAEGGNVIDAVSGATVSSTAVVNAANTAADFIFGNVAF